LEKLKFYRIAINGGRFQNFKSADGRVAESSAIYITAAGASK
jgi:hypothetical protein